MELVTKHFSELTTEELHDIMYARVAVFVVEQECPYPEVDGNDKDAYHVYLKDADGIQAYARVLKPGVTYEEASIGRVISMKRGTGLGREVMAAAIEAARTELGADTVKIGAQVYARGFYEQFGFKQVSEEYLEDDIPHMDMILEGLQSK